MRSRWKRHRRTVRVDKLLINKLRRQVLADVVFHRSGPDSPRWIDHDSAITYATWRMRTSRKFSYDMTRQAHEVNQ